MELILAVSIGVLFGSGIWLVLRPRTFQLLMGLMLMSYAVNLFIFAMGRLWTNMPPLVLGDDTPDPMLFADPLPQALVLTAIVISFGMTALVVVLSLRTFLEAGTDQVDGAGEIDAAAEIAGEGPASDLPVRRDVEAKP